MKSLYNGIDLNIGLRKEDTNGTEITERQKHRQQSKSLPAKHIILQEKLCALLQRRGCDIGRSTYAKYENGELNIKVSVLIELRKIYDCAYGDFFEGLDIQE